MIKVSDRIEFLKSLIEYLPEQSNGAEIGVLHGDFSEQILKTINPKRLFLVDPYITEGKQLYGEELNRSPTAYSTEIDYEKLLKRFAKQISAEQVVVIKKFSYDAIDRFRDESLNFIYHDASHLYEDLKRDLEDWLPKLKQDGVVCGHDYVGFDNFGVIQAVDEFCKEHGFEMIILNANGGDWALRKIKTNELLRSNNN